jgi:beta-lactamase regulating signal transducer with metallopeptidase domain/vancomycin resistance protein YoaR
MADVFKSVLDISLAASALALLVTAARLIIGQRPNAVLPLLSLLVILRLAIPVVIPSPLSVMNLFSDIRLEQPAAGAPGDVNETISNEFTQPSLDTGADIAENTASENHIQPEAAGPGTNAGGSYAAAGLPAAKPLTAMEIASIVWIVGMAAMAACIAASNIRFLLALRKNRRYDAPGFGELLERCKEELNIRRRIEAVRLSGINTAAVYGTFRPKLLISPSFGWLSDEEKRHVLLHELSHIKRRDTLVCLIITALNAVYWFNPVLWAALALARRDMEIMCDMAVLRLTRDKRSYASTLFSLAKASNTPKPKLVSALFIGPQNALRFGVLISTDSIKRRMKMITRYKRSRLLTAVSIILVFVIAITGCTGAVSGTRAPDETAADFTPPDIEGQELIASYSLDFSSIAYDEARVANIKKAAEMFDGMIFPHIEDSLTGIGDPIYFNNILDTLGPITEEAGWRNAAWTGWESMDIYIHENDAAGGYFADAQDTAADTRPQASGGIEIAAMAVYRACSLAGIDCGSIIYADKEDNVENGGLEVMNNIYVSDLVLKMWVENNCVTAAFYAKGAAEKAEIPVRTHVPEPGDPAREVAASYSLDCSCDIGIDSQYNIEKALALLDGKVLKPGEQLSLNNVMGDRSAANGWKESWDIVDGKYVKLYGAGVDAVACALYNAALRAELDIVKVTHGKIKSVYVPGGLDATVLADGADLIIGNPFDNDISIEAKLVDEYYIDIYIYGPQKDYIVDYSSMRTGGTEAPPQIYIYNAATAPGGIPIEPGESFTMSESQRGEEYRVYKVIKEKPDELGKASVYETCTYPPMQGYTYVNSPDPAGS